ncbi:MAG: ABC transporter permease subunit [Evtepia gabavorous]
MSSNLPFILLIFLPLMAVMAASDLFVGEQVDHTLRFSLMRPVGKGKLFFSKAAAVFLLCAFDLAVLYVVSTVAQSGPGRGHGGDSHQPGGLPAGPDPPGGAGSFLLPDQSAGERVQPDGPAVCGFVHRAAGYGDLSARGGGLVFTGYLRWHNLWIGIALPFFSLLPRIGLLAGYGLVFGCCGYLLFDRKEA